MYTLEQGQKFERYRILRCLGNGTAGISYEAEDTRQKRTVTLKLIHPHASLPDAARRQFFRDMQHRSSLSDPMLMPMLNYGEMNGQLFIVRPYSPLGSLLGLQGRLWFNPPLPVPTALTCTLQLAHTLAYMHGYECVHGSLTLSNLLISSAPRGDEGAALVLTDSGQATFVRRHGQPQSTLFSPMAAPEQFQNQQSAASDQYAVAILLYFWLTGSLPFLGSPDEVKRSKQQADFPALYTYNASLTELQEHIIRRALQPHPRDRYATMEDFAAVLAQALTQTVQTPRPLSGDDVQTDALVTRDIKLPQPPADDVTDATGGLPLQRKTTEPLVQIHRIQPVPLDAYLVITLPHQHEVQQYHITQRETTLGRAGSSDVLLDRDELTSRHHALIVRQEQSYCIYDQRSTHGVKVNSRSVREGEGYPLENGDRIFIGDYTLVFYLALPPEQMAMKQEPLTVS